jgi:regulatory protein
MNFPKKEKSYSLPDAYAKAAAYCAYQERSRREVREKLHEYGLTDDQAEELLERLSAENFLNEERFAKAFAGGKFRLKKWGRLKIRQELKAHGLSDFRIRQALDEIDPEAYEAALRELLEKKNALERASSVLQRKQKLLRFGVSKGYEQDMVWEVINELV